ncbi:DNA polymerase III subunit delta' [Sulfurirhabdus autotrophica]|uniref:DNA polymerase III subunit delta' n=1 Tax=Sulfurirhabdus autotrophica TaxID=1706046 RepID=A0A4R3YGK2_9PROT|nr:DNA polymerase III subunit delta' [Sulfurirhabdus autotrophica]TCV90074.1 DNA polymerase III delta prime subunit [Sulfurirhabdus autotrophica]
MTLYSWQKEIWHRIQSRKDNLPHAILLQGRTGIGKFTFARLLAQGLLCESPLNDGLPCGQCAACGWFEQMNHPDYRLIESEALSQASGGSDDKSESSVGVDESKAAGKKASNQIKVSQVRELLDFVNLSTHRSGMRIILVHPAESLNINTANALLKILEEPPPKTLFILITHQPQRLLPTIRSRCQKLDMPLPEKSLAIDWLTGQGVDDPALCLAQAGGAPLAALELSNATYQQSRKTFVGEMSELKQFDPLAAAERYQKIELTLVMNWLQKWIYDLLSFKMAGEVLYHPDFAKNLQELAKTVNLSALLNYQRELIATQRVVNHPLNALLLLESLFLSYADIFEPV